MHGTLRTHIIIFADEVRLAEKASSTLRFWERIKTPEVRVDTS